MKPIIFSAPMVRAILDGRKSQTRRVIKDILVPDQWPTAIQIKDNIKCAYDSDDRLLWVRETFYKHKHIGMKFSDEYEALPDNLKPYYRKCSAIFMSKWASRITLKISDVRVERLQEISEKDAISEGILAVASFADIWNSINGKKHPWASNPWVWVIDFERVGR